MPISRERRLTEYATSAYSPTMASARPISPRPATTSTIDVRGLHRALREEILHGSCIGIGHRRIDFTNYLTQDGRQYRRVRRIGFGQHLQSPRPVLCVRKI
jgi:hypothetical protein